MFSVTCCRNPFLQATTKEREPKKYKREEVLCQKAAALGNVVVEGATILFRIILSVSIFMQNHTAEY